MTACEPLELEILPPYIGSAVSPMVDITETTTDVTVTITDFRGEHSYSVEKTDQAIADAEQAASNANTAAANATATANAAAQYARNTADQAAADAQETADEAAGRADTAAASATQAAQAANTAAGTANTSAQNADTKAAFADSKATLANTAATTANQAAQAAEAATTAANTAAGNATTAAGTASTAAGNADAKAQLADTAATNADTATANAQTATTNATNAAQAANNAADVAIEAAEDMPKLVGTASGTTAQTVNDAWPTTPESATLYGKSVQDGTPTPENPVAVQVVGAPNLIAPGNDETYQDARGVTITRTDGVYTITGTAISTGGRLNDIYKRQNVQLAAGTYTFTGNVSGTGAITLFVENHATNAIIATASGANVATFTLTETTTVFIGANINNTGAYDVTFKPMLVSGTHATPYTPYGCIGLQTGETVTPIDLQGNVLASLPDGTRDVLRVDSAGRVWIEQNVHAWDLGDFAWGTSSSDNHIFRQAYSGITPAMASIPPAYNGYPAPALCDEYQIKGYSPLSASDHGYLAIGNGLVVAINHDYSDVAAFTSAMSGVLLYYELAEPQTIELGTITPPDIAPGDTLAIYASLDPEWAIEYTQDPSIVVNTIQSSIAPVEGATASTNYSVGAYLMHGNQLYRVTSAIATGEAIAPGSNCVACTVMGEIVRLTA